MPRIEPEINYLAKDYASFRRLMLDRMALLMPGGVEDQPADLQVALIEMLAYMADHLSYYQDAVATEAYLGTARSRISLRRHARLLSYRVHEGCNARVWIACEVAGEKPVKVTTGWRFSTIDTVPVDFEPCHQPTLYAQHNEIAFDVASGTVLKSGSTEAKIVQTSPALQKGDLLLLEANDLDTDSGLCHIVRLIAEPQGGGPVTIRWHADDALPFDLPIRRDGSAVAVARGNVLLADQGRTERFVLHPDVPGGSSYTLPEAGLTWVTPLPSDLLQQQDDGIVSSALELMKVTPTAALPAIGLEDELTSWSPHIDLLECGGDEPAFVVETEKTGSVKLRFGDGTYGRLPAPGTVFSVECRRGVGQAGNVGAETVTGLIGTGIANVKARNPLPATGGEDPELPERVRLFAPQAFRVQQRAVTADDYAARAEQFTGVQRAAAEIRWTGSWYTVYLFVDRTDGVSVDDKTDFRQRLLAYMDGYRLAGYDLEIVDPIYVAPDIALTVEVRAGFVAKAVLASLLDAFSTSALSASRRGYFHPDNWTFGQSVYLSDVYRAALAVPGVAAIDAGTFQRRGDPRGKEARDRGVIDIGHHEIVCHDIPQSGRVVGDGRLYIELTGRSA